MAYSPKYETRAVWLTTLFGLDWPHHKATDHASMLSQQDELSSTLDRLKAAGINTVMLQTRVRATTIYPSDIEPWDECLTGRGGGNPGYDPLAFAISECHKRGMELHAWVVALPIGKWNSYGCRRLRKLHPKMVKKIDDEGYLNPEYESTSQYIADICAEIASRYDIDGLHFDYLRYPETWSKKGHEDSGRYNITHIAAVVSRRVKSLKPWAKISCSPIGKHDDLPRQSSKGWNARTRVCQDAQLWLDSHIMDQLYPMMYFRGENFYPFAFDWQQSAPQSHSIVAGLGIYQMDRQQQDWPLGDMIRQMSVCRSLGIGQCFFRSQFFTSNTKGIYDFTASKFYKLHALTPPTPNPQGSKPNAPSALRQYSLGDTLLMEWTAPTPQYYTGADLYFTLYADNSWPVDIDNAQNIVAQHLQQCRIAIANPPRGLYYAVTATDRFGTESSPCQQSNPYDEATNESSYCHASATSHAASNRLKATLIRLEGNTLNLPATASLASIAFLRITSATGVTIRNIPYHGQKAITTHLSTGLYYLDAISKKRKSHRLASIIVPINAASN